MPTETTLFKIPKGTVCNVVSEELQCHRCGAVGKNVRFIAMATDRYEIDRSGQKRRYFVFHNVLCSCDEGCWLHDGPVSIVVEEIHE